MKIKLNWIQELRGASGVKIWGDKSCFQVRPGGVQILMKNPGGKRVPQGKQNLYRHQFAYWSYHWNFLTPAQKANYEILAEADGITGYDFYIREKHQPGFLYLHPTNNRAVEIWDPNNNVVAQEALKISDDTMFEDWVYIDFGFEKISRNLSLTKAELCLKLVAEGGWDADGKRVDCHKILEPWRETTITYNNRPTVSGTETDNLNMPTMGEWLAFDVTNDIQDQINTGALFYGWRIKFHTLVAVHESLSGFRSTHPHDEDCWPYVKISL